MGANAGLAAGRFAGAKEAPEAVKAEVAKVDVGTLSDTDAAALKLKMNELAKTTGQAAGTTAGKAAGESIDINAIVAEAVAEAKKAVEAQADEIQAFMAMSADIAQEAGKIAGEEAGEAAGAIAGEKAAVEAVLAKAIEAAEKAGVAIFAEIG